MNESEKEKIKQALKDQLKGVQLESLNTVQWLYYGARGGGRTHLVCTAALLEVAEGREVWLVDHSPWTPMLESYVEHVLLNIATKANMKIRVTNYRRGALRVGLDEKSYKKSA